MYAGCSKIFSNEMKSLYGLGVNINRLTFGAKLFISSKLFVYEILKSDNAPSGVSQLFSNHKGLHQSIVHEDYHFDLSLTSI